MAEGVGFEPTAPFGVADFQDQFLKPLGHPSKTYIFTSKIFKKNGVPEGIRTPGTWLRRPLLYPAELQAHIIGAGEGDRTLATGLEGRGSTTELHPHKLVEEIGFEPM